MDSLWISKSASLLSSLFLLWFLALSIQNKMPREFCDKGDILIDSLSHFWLVRRLHQPTSSLVPFFLSFFTFRPVTPLTLLTSKTFHPLLSHVCLTCLQNPWPSAHAPTACPSAGWIGPCCDQPKTKYYCDKRLMANAIAVTNNR